MSIIKRINNIFASSCFLSLWFKLVLDLDFCISKNFIKTVRLKLLKKEQQVKNKLSMEYWNNYL